MANAGSKECDLESAGAGADAVAVEDALARVLASDKFRASERLRQFLIYVVQESLAGQAHRIKAYTIATEVFGRSADFNAAIDPIVRIEAARLRRSLEHYYLTAGVNDPLVIQIPKGGYSPVFHEGSAEVAVAGPRAQPDASVAVIPLQDLTGDPKQGYFAAGMTEEIQVALGQYPSIRIVPVTARDPGNAAYDEVDKSLATFALHGAIRTARDTLRVTARLIECSTKTQIWARTYDRTLTADNLIDVQDDIAHEIVVSLAENYGGAIIGSLARRSRNEEAPSNTAYDAVLRLHHYYNPGWSEPLWRETRKSLERALELEPDNVPVMVALAEVLVDGWCCSVTEAALSDLDRAEALLQNAISLDREYEYAFFPLALIEIARRNRAAVVSIAQRLVDKTSPLTNRLLAGWLLVVAGDYDVGEPILRESTERLSQFPRWAHHALMLCHLKRHEFDDTLAEADAFEMPGLLWSPLNRAIALSYLEIADEAGKAYASACELQPEVAVHPRRYISRYILDEELVDEIMAKLHSNQVLGDEQPAE